MLIFVNVLGSSITSESENEFDASDLPSTTRSNQGFVIDQRVTIDVVDEIADVIDNSDFGKLANDHDEFQINIPMRLYNIYLSYTTKPTLD